MTRYAIGAVLLALAGLALAGGPAADRADVRLVFLGEKRPHLLRLAVEVDGKPYLDAWDDAVGKLFRLLDTDGDGSLSAAEAAAVPPPEILFRFQPGAPFWIDGPLPTLALLDTN